MLKLLSNIKKKYPPALITNIFPLINSPSDVITTNFQIYDLGSYKETYKKCENITEINNQNRDTHGRRSVAV